ncbi:hypothetical protein [Pseudactinotalea suaedae]|uniref:hypothetical protein n=1 Tax=Pseudactinotalea suaedae TaxID=1524924 RepID=UPI0012E1C9A7|nr:hypothetical protein [Pseudactinotalea suaedae]
MTLPPGGEPRRVNGQPFGAWVVKANPALSDVDALLAAGGTDIAGWCVQQNYRSHLMRPDDLVFLWISGGSRTVVSGFWAVGLLEDPPLVADEAAESTRGAAAAPKAGLVAQLTLAVVESPVSRAACQADPVLAEIEVLRVAQIGNPSFLTPEGRDRLLALMQTSAPRRITSSASSRAETS